MIFAECKLFRDIVQSRSLSRGAALNGISQSAASQHIQELERRLDAALLDRSVRPVEVTTAGKLYFELCRDVIRREEDFHSAYADLKRSGGGDVHLVCIYSFGLPEMARLQSLFERQFPHTKLFVEFLRPDRIYQAVSTDAADLGLISYPESSRDVKVIPWRNERMAAVAAPTHRLAEKRRVSAADFHGLDFIAFDGDLGIRRQVDRYLREGGAEIHVAMQFDNTQTIKEAVALGTGVSILPECTVEAEVAQGKLKAIPLRSPGLLRPVGIVHRRRRKLNRASRSFISLLEGKPDTIRP